MWHTAKQEEITTEDTAVQKRDPKKQVKADSLDAFLEKLDKEGIGYEFVAIPISDIKPEQKEIKREKVDAIKESLDKGEELACCYVDKNNSMCDGHHRMISVEEKYGEDYHLPCVRIDAECKKVFELMESMNKKAIKLTDSPLPKILTKDGTQIDLQADSIEFNDKQRRQYITMFMNGVFAIEGYGWDDITPDSQQEVIKFMNMIKTAKQQFTLQLSSATDVKRALEAMNALTYNTVDYKIDGNSIILENEEDLADIKTLLQNKGVMGLEKRNKETLQNNKMSELKYANLLTGEEESIEVEPEIVAVIDDEEPVEESSTCSCEKIDANQSKDSIKDQLIEEFNKQYPRAKTYENIFNCASDCGLVDSMDKYDLINIMNSVATESGLQRIDFSEYFGDDEIMESADIKGTSGAPEFNEGDVEGAIKEFMNSFENEAESLYDIDRKLDERIKLLMDGSKLVEASKKIVRETLKDIKKDALVHKYSLSDFKVYDTDRAGRIVKGKLLYKVEMRYKRDTKIHRTVGLELPIVRNMIQRPKQFSYNNETMPLSAWFLNDIFER